MACASKALGIFAEVWVTSTDSAGTASSAPRVTGDILVCSTCNRWYLELYLCYFLAGTKSSSIILSTVRPIYFCPWTKKCEMIGIFMQVWWVLVPELQMLWWLRVPFRRQCVAQCSFLARYRDTDHVSVMTCVWTWPKFSSRFTVIL